MGGNMFPNAGAIHKSEVTATTKAVEAVLGLHLDGQTLGSVGKKEYSGDLDYVITLTMPKDEFKALLENKYGRENVRPLNDGYTVLVPIASFNRSHNKRKPRTGFVQTDFVISDDHEYTKFFLHSPGEESQYKGAHRTSAMCAMVRLIDPVTLDKTLDSFDRPIKALRWKLSEKSGLVRVERSSLVNPVTKEWMKKTQDVPLETIRDPAKIAKVLFKETGTLADLESLESLVKAVKRVYPERKEDFFFEMMTSLINSKLHIDYNLPRELERYK